MTRRILLLLFAVYCAPADLFITIISGITNGLIDSDK